MNSLPMKPYGREARNYDLLKPGRTNTKMERDGGGRERGDRGDYRSDEAQGYEAAEQEKVHTPGNTARPPNKNRIKGKINNR